MKFSLQFFAVFLVVKDIRATVSYKTLAPCGFLNGGRVMMHPKLMKPFCYFPISRKKTHYLYAKKNFSEIKIAYPKVTAEVLFRGYDSHAKACSLFNADLFTADNASEVDLIFNNGFVELLGSFISKYRFYKDGQFVTDYLSDTKYIDSLLGQNQQQRSCAENDTSQCCVLFQSQGRSFGVVSFSCSKYSSDTAVCKMPTEPLKFIEKTSEESPQPSTTTAVSVETTLFIVTPRSLPAFRFPSRPKPPRKLKTPGNLQKQMLVTIEENAGLFGGITIVVLLLIFLLFSQVNKNPKQQLWRRRSVRFSKRYEKEEEEEDEEVEEEEGEEEENENGEESIEKEGAITEDDKEVTESVNDQKPKQILPKKGFTLGFPMDSNLLKQGLSARAHQSKEEEED